jgi:hypothetical protein
LTGQSKFIEVKKVEYIPTIRDEKKSDLDLNSLPRQPMNSITINKDSQLVVTTVDNQINNSNVKCPSEKELQAETPNNEFGIIDNTGEKLQINQLAEVIKDVQIQQQIKRRGRPPKTQNGPKI